MKMRMMDRCMDFGIGLGNGSESAVGRNVALKHREIVCESTSSYWKAIEGLEGYRLIFDGEVGKGWKGLVEL